MDNNQKIDIENIAFQLEQLKAIHHGAIKLIDSIQDEISALSQNSEASPTELPKGQGFELLGKWHNANSGNEILVGVLRELCKIDSGFPEKLEKKVMYEGRTRRYIAKKVGDLYPNRPDLAKYNEKIAEGWYVGTNESNEKKIQLLKTACEIMGIHYGVKLRVRMG